ncbi:xanthine dehydrogenase family protein molybdopterin-binding subunit [Ramlibacter algicola]|uniref:Xanthine dehydrogenase family protein molybdopterin-binding subunit n=1 Tax=Ramlibacter algicola TaxID=2795217 RepID=A0A934USX7_9BURK|nr:xanthine dehydrogenase family protein molybdopterin-binding subunit [Ramlibacter algicola]MBK0393952.1 xanthine dehydrogenase family protein molybdopterin-binding subunit [Ramlibacter algicola]
MKFDTPATTNPIDQGKVVGQPVDRIDGLLKATGTAPYAYERHDVAPNAAYGWIIGAAIGKGRIKSMDLDAARRAPGVIAIVTAQDAGPLGKGRRNTAKLLGGPEIDHYHQAVAVVVAETFEQARAAASLVRIDYERTDGRFDLAKGRDGAIEPGKEEADTAVGDFAGAFASAEVKVDATYTTPDESHAMMEPHATIAAWNGDQLTVWTSNQMVDWGRTDLAATLKMPKDKVRLVSPFVGGGFGGKLFLRADALMAALAARAARRPVKIALQRSLMPNNTTHRPATIQRVRIGARRDGTITAIAHEAWSGDLPQGEPDSAVHQTRMLYAGAHRMTATRLATLDLPESNAMRAPGEATGHMALEIAMDELAEALGMDPVQLRIRNDTQVVPDFTGGKAKDDPQGQKGDSSKGGEPRAGHPFSKRQFVQCLQLGAEKFGWNKRVAQPGQVRDGRWLVGLGMAGAYRGAPTTKSAARVRLDARGMVIVETDMTDIGTGSYTILGQTAAEMLGVPLRSVFVRLGDSDFPVSSGSGGQFGAASSTAGVYAACVKLREAIAQRMGVDPAAASFVDGQVRAGSHSVALRQLAAQGELVGEDAMEFGELSKKTQQGTFGAHFVEVGVDAFTAEVRVRRMLAVCAAGRILNPKTARSQVIGAMTMGVGAALMEELAVDKRLGFFVNHDLASYEVPVHADIPHQDVIFLDEVDPMATPLKAKGVGELGICGVSAAVANAIHNATGVRVRDYPITLDKILRGRSPVA